MLETIATITVVSDLLLLGLGGALIKYMVKVESRLTRIETKLNLD